jgi:hypothetical protein
MNGLTANISIPGDAMLSPKLPKSPTSQAVVEKHLNGAKVGNHYNNNSKVNSACLNNLILPLLSEVSCREQLFLIIRLISDNYYYCPLYLSVTFSRHLRNVRDKIN